jgi:hypothetical protein
VALENEDLWVYCNLFYFDHRISESKELSFSENINDIEVFSTILSIFFKFPYYLFNNDYLLFSKTLQHVILGNNTNLYNSNQDLVEPYNKPELRLDQQENFKFVGFPYIFKKPDFFFVRKLLKSLFIFKGKRKGSFIKRRRMYHKLFKRRNFNFNSDSFSNFKFFHGLNGKLYKQSNISKISSFFKLQNYESPIINKFSFKYNLLSGKSRMESRFLRFFWFSFPFYFLAIQRFFYNFFPVYNPKNCSFFISKVIILSVNFFKSFISAFLNFFFSFTISNVTKMDVLGDLRRIKGSSKIKQIFKSKDQKKRTGKKKELNKKIYENTKFFLRRSQYKRILYSKNSRYFLRKIDYLENDYDFFFAKKRVFSKRFVRKKNIKLRLLWMNRSRFIFPNVYNNTKSINSHIGPTDLFNLLEYFYFVLGADRDLFDNAVYSLIVSTLREKYGDIIVRDLLSREDHKQARSVSVILHVNERENEILNTTSSNLDFFADNNIFDSGELKPNLKLDFELSKISGKSLLVLSPYMSRYLNHLLRYFKVFCNVKNK